jgi:hypothetical protein
MLSIGLRYDEAAHFAIFSRKIAAWDSLGTLRLQSRGKVIGIWAHTPIDCLVFIALPLVEEIDEDFDRIISASRMRDVLGDLSKPNESNRIAEYRLPDEFPLSEQLSNLPPEGGRPWIQGERMTCDALISTVETAIQDYHQQLSLYPSATQLMKDNIATQIWKRPGIAGFPLRGLHAARQLGFIAHKNARAEFATLESWKRLITPAGQVFVDERMKKAKLRVI